MDALFWCSVSMIVKSTNLSIINPRVEKHLRTTTEIEEKQPPTIVPLYWYGSHPYVFPMGKPMMLISTNAMVTLPMPIWNPMTYSMKRVVHPSVPTTQIHVIVLVPINT